MNRKSLNSRRLWDPTSFTPFWYPLSCYAEMPSRAQLPLQTSVEVLSARPFGDSGQTFCACWAAANQQSSLQCDGRRSIESRDSAHTGPPCQMLSIAVKDLLGWNNIHSLIPGYCLCKISHKMILLSLLGGCRWLLCRFSLWLNGWPAGETNLRIDTVSWVAYDGKYCNNT